MQEVRAATIMSILFGILWAVVIGLTLLNGQPN
jgi:hypothetical protein